MLLDVLSPSPFFQKELTLILFLYNHIIILSILKIFCAKYCSAHLFTIYCAKPDITKAIKKVIKSNYDNRYYNKGGKKTQELYCKTEKGKIVNRKFRRETYAKRRNMKSIIFIDNPFPEEIKMNYHHINNFLVIPLPKKLHLMNNGKNRDKHRIKCKEIIMKLYCLNIDKILSP